MGPVKVAKGLRQLPQADQVVLPVALSAALPASPAHNRKSCQDLTRSNLIRGSAKT